MCDIRQLKTGLNLGMMLVGTFYFCGVNMRKRTKRKVYSLVDPIRMAVMGACLTAEAPLNKLRLSELSSIDSLTKGVGTVADWQALSDCLNVAESMCFLGVGKEEVQPICQVAQNALLSIAKRYEVQGRFVLKGEEIKAIKELLEWHDVQRSSVARAVYERAIQRSCNLIKSKHSTVLEIV